MHGQSGHHVLDEPAHWREALAKATEKCGRKDNCLGVNSCEKRRNGECIGIKGEAEKRSRPEPPRMYCNIPFQL